MVYHQDWIRQLPCNRILFSLEKRKELVNFYLNDRITCIIRNKQTVHKVHVSQTSRCYFSTYTDLSSAQSVKNIPRCLCNSQITFLRSLFSESLGINKGNAIALINCQVQVFLYWFILKSSFYCFAFVMWSQLYDNDFPARSHKIIRMCLSVYFLNKTTSMPSVMSINSRHNYINDIQISHSIF